MSSYNEARENLKRFIKVRIPLIVIATDEKSRALRMMREISDETRRFDAYVQSLTGGIRELNSDREFKKDGSLEESIPVAISLFNEKPSTHFVFTDVDVSQDDPISRHMLDLSLLAAKKNGVILLITEKSTWPMLMRQGMRISLDRSSPQEMATTLENFLTPFVGRFPIAWDSGDYARAGEILAGLTEIEAKNIVSTFLGKESGVTKADLEGLPLLKDQLFLQTSGLEKIPLKRKDLTIGGLEGLRSWLDQERALMHMNPDDTGIRPPRGVLLSGVPGCGKSLSAKVIADSWNLPLYRLDLANIHGEYLGQSESRLKSALDAADKAAPCVLWIDEIEKGLAGSGGSGHETSTRLVGHFLFWLQESHAKVFVVATSNDISRLPPELFRKGRFDEIFFVDLPTPKEREGIFALYIEKYLKRKPSPDELQSIAEASDGYSGSDIEASVRSLAKIGLLKGATETTAPKLLELVRQTLPFAKANPQQLEAIRAWGRERARPASGSTQSPDNFPRLERMII